MKTQVVLKTKTGDEKTCIDCGVKIDTGVLCRVCRAVRERKMQEKDSQKNIEK